MIISPDNQVATYSATQPNTTQTLTIVLSSDAVQELDLPEGQVVKGTVSEDGKSITLETENGTVNLVGSFAQVSGEDVNVRVKSTGAPADTEVKEGLKTEGQEPTRQSKLDQVFENTAAKVDDSEDVEKLLTDLKAAIESGESSVFGELELFSDLPPVEVDISQVDTEKDSFLWEAPEARESEEAAEGSNSVDFGDGEINSGEEEWMGFDQLLGSDDDWEINIDTEIGDRDHIWLQGRVSDNHGRFNMWFDNVGTAAYAKQNINEVAQKIESFGIIIDHLGIAPYPRDRVEDPPKSTFMIEV
jgi:hypothetical protein